MKKELNALTKGVDPLAGGGICRVNIVNETPPKWKAVIVAAASQFFYKDEREKPDGNYKDVETGISVGSGQSITLESNDSTKCVGRVNTVIWVKVPSEKEPIKLGRSKDAGKGKCLLNLEQILKPKDQISIRALSQGVSVTELMEFAEG